FYPYEAGVSAGKDFCVFDVPEVGRFGVSICYDIWFPETNRMLTALGAEVLLHPVLTNTVDRNVELAMAQAAAAQFQMYVFDINGLGEGGVGRSCVVNPAGSLLHLAGAGEEIVPIEIDLEKVRRQREAGLHGLGQPLKSFRDFAGEFPVYSPAYAGPNYPRELGPLQLPRRGSRDLAPDPAALPAASQPKTAQG
ncbi:MAG: carbon-nitrogen hydrolase family protein, partial [Woeseiaceae bacterium]|nr:carbon-nitrogen hydrolase family protein [Woeseiaceae bacterium]